MRSKPIIAFLLMPTAVAAQFAPSGRPPVERPLQPIVVDGRMPTPSIRREVDEIRDRIGRSRGAGTLSRREARQYRREAQLIEALAGRYSADGLSTAEGREVEVRARVLRDILEARRSTGGSGAR